MALTCDVVCLGIKCVETNRSVARLDAKKLPAFRQRLVEHYRSYAYATAHEADLRIRNDILSPEDYRDLRRETSAVRVCFDMFEYAIGQDLPNDLFDDEAFRIVYWAGVDMVAWSNASFFCFTLALSIRYSLFRAVYFYTGLVFIQHGTIHWS